MSALQEGIFLNAFWCYIVIAGSPPLHSTVTLTKHTSLLIGFGLLRLALGSETQLLISPKIPKSQMITNHVPTTTDETMQEVSSLWKNESMLEP